MEQIDRELKAAVVKTNSIMNTLRRAENPIRLFEDHLHRYAETYEALYKLSAIMKEPNELEWFEFVRNNHKKIFLIPGVENKSLYCNIVGLFFYAGCDEWALTSMILLSETYPNFDQLPVINFYDGTSLTFEECYDNQSNLALALPKKVFKPLNLKHL